MKRFLSTILSIVLLTLTFTACSVSKAPESKLSNGTQDQKEAVGTGDTTNADQGTQTSADNLPQTVQDDSQEVEDPTAGTAVKPDEGRKIKLTVLDKSWKKIGQYSEGLCPVQDNDSGLWGYVDKSGEYVIKPSYYYAYPFSEGLAAVQNKDGKFIFIDKTDKVIIADNYMGIYSRYSDGVHKNSIRGFLGGYALVTVQGNSEQDYKFTLIDKAGKIIAQDNNFQRISDLGKKAGPLIECQGTFYDMQYNKVTMPNGNYSDNYRKSGSKYILCGDKVVDEKGAVIFDASGKVISMLTDDYIVVSNSVNGIQTSAVYDFSGNVVVDYKYKFIYPFDSDTFMVANNGDKYGVINKKQEELVPIAQSQDMAWSLKGFSIDQIKYTDNRYYDLQTGMNRLSYMGTDDNGNPVRYYYDLAKKQVVKDAQVFNPDGSPTYYNYINGDAVYKLENGYITVYNTDGVNAGRVQIYLGESVNGVLDAFPFLEDNIIPTASEGQNGYTLAVIE